MSVNSTKNKPDDFYSDKIYKYTFIKIPIDEVRRSHSSLSYRSYMSFTYILIF